MPTSVVVGVRERFWSKGEILCLDVVESPSGWDGVQVKRAKRA